MNNIDRLIDTYHLCLSCVPMQLVDGILVNNEINLELDVDMYGITIRSTSSYISKSTTIIRSINGKSMSKIAQVLYGTRFFDLHIQRYFSIYTIIDLLNKGVLHDNKISVYTHWSVDNKVSLSIVDSIGDGVVLMKYCHNGVTSSVAFGIDNYMECNDKLEKMRSS